MQWKLFITMRSTTAIYKQLKTAKNKINKQQNNQIHNNFKNIKQLFKLFVQNNKQKKNHTCSKHSLNLLKKQYPQPPQRKKKTKNINYIQYMNQFQVSILYEFAKEIQKNHPEKKIWIIEDNVSCHLAAKHMTKCIQIKKKIKYVFHFVNSPNLNKIELFWGEIKYMIIFFDLKLSKTVVLNICQKKINYILNYLN